MELAKAWRTDKFLRRLDVCLVLELFRNGELRLSVVISWRCGAAQITCFEWVWLQAVMVVSDADISLTITGNGDVLEPYDGVIGMI